MKNMQGEEMDVQFLECDIEGVRRCSLSVHPDRRGSFFEIFRKRWLPSVFEEDVQVNCSRSTSGALRGMHYHKRQWDLWVPVSGRMVAGLADIREDSATYTRSLSIPMDADEPQALLIPPGVAHGFSALTDLIVIYVVNNYYDGCDEFGIAWNDPGLDIDWGLENPVLSERDMKNDSFDWT